MRLGSRRAAWLFLLLGALSGAYAVPSPRVSSGINVEICWLAQRVPAARIAEHKQDAQPAASCSPRLAAFPRETDSFVRCAVRGALYRRPPPFLFQR